MTASIGSATAAGCPSEELLASCRTWRVVSRQARRQDQYVVFQTDMHSAVQTRMELEQDLRQAIVSDEFFLRLQPTFDLP